MPSDTYLYANKTLNPSRLGKCTDTMDRIVWKDDYSVGHPDIDDQHRYFIGLINNVIKAQELSYPEDMIHQLLFGLLKYSEFHFRGEELIMRANRYPEFEKHAKLHGEIMTLLEHKVGAFGGKEGGIDDILGMLVAWFQIHTVHEDKRFATFLAEAKAAPQPG